MCKTKEVEPRIVEQLDYGTFIAVIVLVAVVILLLLALLLFCFIRNRRQKKMLEEINRRDERVDENPDYGIYRDGCVEYSTVTDTNSKFEVE